MITVQVVLDGSNMQAVAQGLAGLAVALGAANPPIGECASPVAYSGGSGTIRILHTPTAEEDRIGAIIAAVEGKAA